MSYRERLSLAQAECTAASTISTPEGRQFREDQRRFPNLCFWRSLKGVPVTRAPGAYKVTTPCEESHAELQRLSRETFKSETTRHDSKTSLMAFSQGELVGACLTRKEERGGAKLFCRLL